MPTVAVRPVIDSDIPVLVEIAAMPEAFRLGRFAVTPEAGESLAEAWQRTRADRSKVLRAAVADGEMIGYVLAYDTGSRFPPIDCAIDTTGRGDEIAAAALGAFVDGFPRRPIRVWVEAANTRAITVLDALLFDPTGERTGDDGQPEVQLELAFVPARAGGNP